MDTASPRVFNRSRTTHCASRKGRSIRRFIAWSRLAGSPPNGGLPRNICERGSIASLGLGRNVWVKRKPSGTACLKRSAKFCVLLRPGGFVMGWLCRLRSTILRSNLDEDFTEETRFHLDERIEDYVKGGMTYEQARLEAHRRLGNLALVREQMRDVD